MLKCHSLEHKQHDAGWYGKCICHKYICFFFVGGLTADASYKDWSALYIARKIFAVLRIISNYTFRTKFMMNQTYTFAFMNWSWGWYDVTNVKTNLETMYNNNPAKHEGKFQRNGLHHNHILIFHLVWNLEIFSSERQKETRKKVISWPIFLCWIPNVHQESINCHGLAFL